MKKLFIAALCVLCASAFGQEFSVSGKIDGVQKGDTLSFLKMDFPGFEWNEAFFVLADDNGHFRHEGTQEHATNYLVQYKPVAGKVPELDRMGIDLFVGQGDRLHLQGERNLWGFCRIEGGVYDHPLYGEIRRLEDALGRARSTLLQRLQLANEQNDKEASRQLLDQFNHARMGSPEIDSLWRVYIADPTAGENAVTRILSRVTSTEFDELERNCAALSDRLKKSHHGQILTAEFNTIRALAVGNPAPDFALVNDQGTLRLVDFRGKYLLIYHWGACPGSIQIDPQVQKLFRSIDSTQGTIIGVTEGRTDVETMHANVSPGTTFAGIDLKECLSGMLAHPFPDYDLNRGDNKQLSQRFAFGGLPYFVLIDPEGKIVARGYHEVFFQAQKLLPRAQAVKGEQ